MGQGSLNAAGSAGVASQSPAGTSVPRVTLPSVECALKPADVLERLSAASRRGRLPGYRNHAEPDGVLFSVAAFGHPFDGVLRARASEGDGRTRLRFECKVVRRVPLIFAAALVLTVWPGVYFMDQLMIQLAPGWREAVPTAWWYLPLTILSIPWLVVSVLRRTRRSLAESARHAIDRIAGEIDGRVVGENEQRSAKNER